MAGQVNIVVLADASDAVRGLRQTGDAAEQAQQRVSRAGTLLKTAGAALFGGAVAVGGAAATIGVKTAASMQQSQIAFETLLGSTAKAKQFIGDLSSFAAKTPFTMPGLTDAARQLIGVGQNADSVIPTLTAFGDTAGALGLSQDQFNRVMLATTQALGKGKVQAEEMMQITEAGIPIWPLMSRALGKPVAELQELAQKGKLVTADVLPKLQAQMEKDYGGAMAKQSQTLTGLWSTLTDTVQMGLGKAFIPLTPILGKAATAATALLGKGLEKLSQWIERDAVPWLNRFSAEWTRNIDGTLGGETHQIITGVIGLVRDLFHNDGGGGQTAANLRDVGEAISRAVAEFRAGSDDLPSFNDVLKVTSKVLGWVADNADLVIKVLPFIVAALLAAKAAQSAANASIVLTIPLRIADVTATLALAAANRQLAIAINTATGAERIGVLARIRSTIATAAQRAATIASTIATRTWTAVTWLAKAATDGTLIGIVRYTAALVASKAAALASAIASRAQAAATLVWTGITRTATAVQWAFNAAMDANPIGLVVIAVLALAAGLVLLYRKNETFRKAVDKGWADFKTGAVAIFSYILGFWRTMFDAYSTLFQTWLSAVKTYWSGLVWLKDLAVSVFAGVTGVVGSFLGWLGDTIASGVQVVLGIWDRLTGIYDRAIALRDHILGLFAGAGNWLLDAGKNIVKGLLDGILDAVPGLRSTLGWVTGKVKDWKGPPARDAALLRDSGALIMQGLIHGIGSQLPALRSTLAGVTTTIAGSIDNAAIAPAEPFAAGSAAGPTVVNLTVNVAPGADPAEAGRLAVNAIRAYERRAGRTLLASA